MVNGCGVRGLWASAPKRKRPVAGALAYTDTRLTAVTDANRPQLEHLARYLLPVRPDPSRLVAFAMRGKSIKAIPVAMQRSQKHWPGKRLSHSRTRSETVTPIIALLLHRRCTA